MTLFLYLLCQPCFHPCLHFLPLVYFIDLVPFLFPPCSISECLLDTVYTPSCLVLYKYPSTSPCSLSLKSTKSLLPIPGPCSFCPTRTYARGQHLTSVVVPNWSPVLLEVIPGLGQPLPFCPHPFDPEFVWTLTQRRPGLDTTSL